VSILLAKQADMNAKAGGGWTPVHLAAHQGHLAVVKQLVAGGVQIEAKTDPVEAYKGVLPGSDGHQKPVDWPGVPGKTALDLAREGKHGEVVRYLDEAIKQRGR